MALLYLVFEFVLHEDFIVFKLNIIVDIGQHRVTFSY